MTGVPGVTPRGIASRRPSQQPLQRGIEIAGQFVVVRLARAGQGSHHHQATGGQKIQPVTHEVAKPPLDPVTDDGDADGLAHDETRTHRGSTLPGCVRVR